MATVLDARYPANLRLVPDLSPFLFLRGRLQDEDARAVAFVGSRNASREGLARADRMARILAGQDATVVSGMARGIDTAHNGALAAGGRTIAVLGTGSTRCYPPENAGLAQRIAEHGVLVSQFWRTAEPARHTFPLRNVVTSGISQGTAVIEAGAASGARIQARIALAHGKRLWLVRSLVETQPWARRSWSVAEVLCVLGRDPRPSRKARGARIPAADGSDEQRRETGCGCVSNAKRNFCDEP